MLLKKIEEGTIWRKEPCFRHFRGFSKRKQGTFRPFHSFFWLKQAFRWRKEPPDFK